MAGDLSVGFWISGCSASGGIIAVAQDGRDRLEERVWVDADAVQVIVAKGKKFPWQPA